MNRRRRPHLRTRRPGRVGLGGSILALLGLCATAGCATQRWPGPMRPESEPLPPGLRGRFQPGPTEVDVIRHSDPVTVRRAGATAGFPLAFYDKRERISAGAWVLSGPGGRGELFWPSAGTSVLLVGEGIAIVGEPSRGEPTIYLALVEQARLTLAADDRVEFAQGAQLRGDPEAPSGPFHIQRERSGEILRLDNQSRQDCTIEYRDEEIVLAPGGLVYLPILQSGGAPVVVPPDRERLESDGFRATARGDFDVERLEGGGLAVSGRGPIEVEALGAHVHLDAGQRATFAPLGSSVVAAGPIPTGDPAPMFDTPTSDPSAVVPEPVDPESGVPESGVPESGVPEPGSELPGSGGAAPTDPTGSAPAEGSGDPDGAAPDAPPAAGDAEQDEGASGEEPELDGAAAEGPEPPAEGGEPDSGASGSGEDPR